MEETLLQTQSEAPAEATAETPAVETAPTEVARP